VARADIGSDLDELGIAARKPILVDTNVVLQAGAYRFSATRQHPLDDFVLVTPYPSGRPRCVRKYAFEFAQKDVQQMLFRRHRVLDSQDELHVRAIVNQSFIDKAACAMDVRQIEYFDLGPDTEFTHASRELSDQGS